MFNYKETSLNDWMDSVRYSMAVMGFGPATEGDWNWQDHVYADFSMETLSPKLERKKVCSHSWKTYEGFTQKYDYCVHCDEKKT